MDTNTKMDARHVNKSAQFFSTQSARARIRQLAAPALLTLVGCAGLFLAARPNATTQESRGKPVSITSESTPFGMSLFRLWSNGDIEVMVLGQNNVWSDWKSVATGQSVYAPSTNPNQ